MLSQSSYWSRYGLFKSCFERKPFISCTTTTCMNETNSGQASRIYCNSTRSRGICRSMTSGITTSFAYHHQQRQSRNKLLTGERYFSVNELLRRYAFSRCSLIRDRIVGLLPLLKTGSSFADSYDGTLANLTLRGFLHFLGNMETLVMLQNGLRLTHINLLQELSSWQPSRLARKYINPQSCRGELLSFSVRQGISQTAKRPVCFKTIIQL